MTFSTILGEDQGIKSSSKAMILLTLALEENKWEEANSDLFSKKWILFRSKIYTKDILCGWQVMMVNAFQQNSFLPMQNKNRISDKIEWKSKNKKVIRKLLYCDPGEKQRRANKFRFSKKKICRAYLLLNCMRNYVSHLYW